MTREMNKGLWLRPAEQPKGKNLGWIMVTAAAAAGFAATALAVWEMAGLDVVCAPWAMLAAGIGACVLWGMLAHVRQQGWFYPCVLAALLLLVLLGGQHLRDGISLLWNRLGDARTAASGWVIPEWTVSGTDPDTAALLASVLFGGLGAAVCCLLAPMAAVLIPAMALAGMALLGQDAAFFWLLPVLVAAVVLLTCGGWGREKPVAAMGLSWMIVAVTAGVLVWISGFPGIRNGAAALSEQLHASFHRHQYETQYTTLPEGDLNASLPAEREPQPALVVTMEDPEPMYLRGFTGATYENGVWLPMDNEVLAQNEDLLYWLNLNAFHPAAQFEHAIFDIETEAQTVTVQNMGACSRYLYVPFSLCGAQWPAEDLRSDSVFSDGERIYTFSVISGGGEIIAQALEVLQNSQEEPVLRYRRAESAYRSFVYSHYMDIPAQIEVQLESLGDPGGLTPEQAQAEALAVLERYAREQSVTSFQYATAAALVLRYYGIPARYAEGYVVTAQMTAEAEPGASLTVDSSCAGAWVEVYQDGIGWLPMDLTQGQMEDAQDGTDDPGETEGQAPNAPAEGEELEEKPQDQQAEPEPNGGTLVSLPEALRYGCFAFIAAAAILVLALALRRRVILARRQKRFDSENCNDAVAWIFADAIVLLEQLGICRGSGSVTELLEPAQQRLGGEYAAALGEMIRLNHRAMFSSRPLDQTQREAALAFRLATLEKLKAGTKWYTRLWMQWIRCRY